MTTVNSVPLPEGLSLSNIFVDNLPADPIQATYPRQVQSACYSAAEPKKTQKPSLIAVSYDALDDLGLSREYGQDEGFLQVFSGNATYDGMTPYACCYGGHQFGNWAGQLGDGRAINLGEQTSADGKRWALQLKGAGPTPYSRSADGLAVLRSSVREFLCSEAMFYLGVPTTRALSLMLTGDLVERDMFYDGNREMEPGAVVCRTASNFIRFGSFELPASRGDLSTLKQLVDYTIVHEFPHLKAIWDTNPVDAYVAMFAEVADATCDMIVHWMRVGFVHGVMNTDNMSIMGLTIDYGPYGWLDNFDPNWTPNTTDAQHQRYRYANQPAIAQWNLLQLGNALYPLVKDAEVLEKIIREFSSHYETRWQKMMASKLGLSAAKGNADFYNRLEHLMFQSEVDMTLFYRQLADIKNRFDGLEGLNVEEEKASFAVWLQSVSYANELTSDVKESFYTWCMDFKERSLHDTLSIEEQIALMNTVNPVMVLRNYLAQEAIDLAGNGDYSKVHELLNAIKNPYTTENMPQDFMKKRPNWAMQKAGCSALSCSS